MFFNMLWLTQRLAKEKQSKTQKQKKMSRPQELYWTFLLWGVMTQTTVGVAVVLAHLLAFLQRARNLWWFRVRARVRIRVRVMAVGRSGSLWSMVWRRNRWEGYQPYLLSLRAMIFQGRIIWGGNWLGFEAPRMELNAVRIMRFPYPSLLGGTLILRNLRLLQTILARVKRFSLFFYFPCLFLFLNILILELKPTQPNRLRNLISGLIIIMIFFLKSC